MMSTRMAVAALLLTLVVPLVGTTALAADAPSTPGAAPPDVWLLGAFGRVLGTEPARPATAEPDERPLDAWMRQAPLELEVDALFEDLLEVSVIARSAGDGGQDEQLSAGATMFEGPATPGPAIIVATITTEAAGNSEHAWLVEVPDREPSPDTLFEIPGPLASLVSDRASVSGSPASGCYAYLCVDVGELPPASTLEALRTDVGETLSLKLDDGSAMSGWSGTLTPLGDTRAEAITSALDFSATPQPRPSLTGLETTVPGEWLLQLRADYDRERGWQWFTFRVLAE